MRFLCVREGKDPTSKLQVAINGDEAMERLWAAMEARQASKDKKQEPVLLQDLEVFQKFKFMLTQERQTLLTTWIKAVLSTPGSAPQKAMSSKASGSGDSGHKKKKQEDQAAARASVMAVF